MNLSHLDQFTKAATRNISRRSAIKGFAAATVGGMFGLGGIGTAFADNVMPVWSAFTLETLGTMVNKLIVIIHTGIDDLRGADQDLGYDTPSSVNAFVIIGNAPTPQWNLSDNSGWSPDSIVVKYLDIGPRQVVDHIQSFKIDFEPNGSGLFADNWDMQDIQVYYPKNPHATLPSDARDLDLSQYYKLFGSSNTSPQNIVHRFKENQEGQDGPSWQATNSQLKTGAFQEGWRSCNKCQCMVFSGIPSPCPAGGNHNFTGSFSYVMFAYAPIPQGLQGGWSSCHKCQRMIFAGIPTTNTCPAGGNHSFAGSFPYTMFVGSGVFGSKQGRWRSCHRCQGLFFQDIPGRCPAPGGGPHDASGSWEYMMEF